MAIITGMRPAEMGEIKPFELPVDDMAKGLLAVQKQADEVKNTIALGASALAIETRPFQQDMDTAKKIQDDYMADVNKLLLEVNGDYSKIDNSTIQSLATKYATDDRLRYITNAKVQFDLSNELGRKINMTNGTEIFLGSNDPRKPGLYDENGNFYNFTDWKIESQLKWVDDAASLYDDLGYKLKKAYGFDENKSKFKNWKQFYEWDVITSEKWNSEQIKAIRDEAVFLYDKTGGGRQYRETRQQELKNINPNYSDEQIKQIIDSEVETMVFTLGEARIKHEYVESLAAQPYTYSSKGTQPTTTKKSDDGKMVDIKPNIQTGIRTEHGYEFGSGTYLDYVDQMKTDKPIIQNIQEFADNPSAVTNNTALEMALLGVNPLVSPTEKGDKLYFSGSLVSLDNIQNLTGSKNRSMFRISTVPKKVNFGFGQSIEFPNVLPDDESIMDIDDYTKAYSQVYGISTQQAKTNLLGTSDADGYSSMFDFQYDNKEKRHKLVVNPVITKAVENLEIDLKNQDKKEDHELIKTKLKRIKDKLQLAAVYQNDHKQKLDEYTEYFYKNDLKIKNHEKIIQIAANDAGISMEEIENLRKVEKGKTTSEFDKAKNFYTKARLTAQDNYWKNTFSSNSYDKAPYPGPMSVLNQLSGGKETIRYGVGTAAEVGGGTSYSLNNKNIDNSLLKINSDVNIKNAWGFYTNFYENALQQDISVADIMSTIGEVEYKNLVSQGKKNEIFRTYATRKINSLLKDTDKVNYSKERQIFINNIAEIGKSTVNFNKKDPKTVEYNVPQNYYEIQQTVMNSTNQEIKKLSTDNNFPIADNLIKFFDNVNEEMKRNHDVNYVYYGLPGENKQSDKDLRFSIVEKAWNASTVGGAILTRLKYNETDTKGKKPLREEYNTQDFLDNLDIVIRNKEGADAKIDFTKRKQYMNEMFVGMSQDTDASTSFTADFTLLDYKSGGLNTITIQIPINPNPSDLIEFGIIPLEAKYMNDARVSLQQNANAFFTLEYENNPSLSTTIFKSAFDVAGTDIKKGEYYIYEDVNGRNVPKRVGTLKSAVGFHLDKIFKGVNVTTLDQVNAMIKEVESVRDPNRKNEILTTKYFFSKDNSATDNINALYKIKDKLLLKNTQTETVKETSEEEEAEYEGEEEGK